MPPRGVAGPDAPWPSVDPAIRRRRLLRLAGVLVGAAVRIGITARAGERAQRRTAVCAAAGVLTALGIRVEVINPAVPWPRTGRGHLVVSDHISWLDGLALLVAVRATPVADAGTGDRALVRGLAWRLGVVLVHRSRPRSVAAGVARAAQLLRRGQSVSVQPGATNSRESGPERFDPALLQAAVDAGALVCPVAIRYRVAGDVRTALPCHVLDATPLRTAARAAAARDLVVEVHLLPALAVTTGDHRTPAAPTGSAVTGATAVGGRPPGCPGHDVHDAAWVAGPPVVPRPWAVPCTTAPTPR